MLKSFNLDAKHLLEVAVTELVGFGKQRLSALAYSNFVEGFTGDVKLLLVVIVLHGPQLDLWVAFVCCIQDSDLIHDQACIQDNLIEGDSLFKQAVKVIFKGMDGWFDEFKYLLTQYLDGLKTDLVWVLSGWLVERNFELLDICWLEHDLKALLVNHHIKTHLV